MRDGQTIKRKNGELQIRAEKKVWWLKHFPNVSNKELYLHECGWEVHSAGGNSKSDGRACYIFHLVVSGKGYYAVKGKTYTVEAPMGFVLPPHEKVNYWADKDKPWQYYWVGLNGPLIQELIKKLGIGKEYGDNYLFKIPYTMELIKTFERLMMHTEQTKNNEELYYLALGCGYEIVGYLLQDTHSLSNSKGDTDIEYQILKYVREHYKTVTVNELSEIFYFNRSYIYKIFKKHEHCSVKHYIIGLRIQESMRLLSESDASIGEIAFEVGFNSSVSFCNQFKKINNKTPGQYRATAKNETKIKKQTTKRN
jgi:AraC family transcriptional regulator of arabinose operon